VPPAHPPSVAASTAALPVETDTTHRIGGSDRFRRGGSRAGQSKPTSPTA